MGFLPEVVGEISVRRLFFIIGIMSALCLGMYSCKGDSYKAGTAALDEEDAIIVLADSFELETFTEDCDSIYSAPDSFLLGELETDYGLVQARVLTQLACPEGYKYPDNAVIDSVCLFMYYSSWKGDGNSPMAVNAYLMDRATLNFQRSYYTNIDLDKYCSRDKSILVNHRIVAASEKLDSVRNSSGQYIPMLRMRLNEDFTKYFGEIRSFESQEKFNEQFKGLLIESSFGSSTMLNVTDVALGVYYHFSYRKADKDTTVNDMKAFYANSEVKTVNQITYIDKDEWLDYMKADFIHNYIVAPAGVYTRLELPLKEIVDTITNTLVIPKQGADFSYVKRPYVNMAQLKIVVYNKDDVSPSKLTNENWLQPATDMLLIKENYKEEFFDDLRLPSDTVAILSTLTKETDDVGFSYYCYNFDLSAMLTRQLRNYEKTRKLEDETLQLLLVPVTVSRSSSNNSITRVREEQTVSATLIQSPYSGLILKVVYSGF